MGTQWDCPCCKKSNLEYGSVDFYDDQCYFPRTCPDCGAQWEEWYSMDFIWHENVRGNEKRETEEEYDDEDF